MNDGVKIAIIGDICPVRRVGNNILTKDFTIFNDARIALSGNDLVIANLECPLTQSNDRIKKTGPNLKADPCSVDLLNYLNVNVTALANNHILDFGERGLMDTTNILNENHIKFLGAGGNISEASIPLLINIKGTRICLFNMCEKEYSIAGEVKAGANPFDLITTLKAVKKWRSECDFMILLYHGGIETYNLPTPEMFGNFNFLADSGIDLIVCNHQHVLSGYQIAGKRSIFYGLGNFIFDSPAMWDNPWNYGLILNLHIQGNVLEDFKLTPFEQCNGNPGININHQISARIHKEIEEINLKISENDILKEWNAYCSRQYEEVLADFFIQNRYLRFILKRIGVLNWMVTRQHQRRVHNYLRCSSLMELARDSLKSRISG
jgi:poly-gamma-glutamate synthesis protein (capsule biosynthesis protein)